MGEYIGPAPLNRSPQSTFALAPPKTYDHTLTYSYGSYLYGKEVFACSADRICSSQKGTGLFPSYRHLASTVYQKDHRCCRLPSLNHQSMKQDSALYFHMAQTP